MEKSHRVFVAINLPEDIKKELKRHQEEINSRFTLSQNEGFGEWAKWTSKDNLHITLEFLGNLTEEEVGEACIAAKAVAEKHESFSLNLNQIVYGPLRLRSGQAPKFVWAEGNKSEELSALREDLENYLLEKIRFAPAPLSGAKGTLSVPHVTLARINEWEFRKIEPEERPEINENIDLLFTVESIDVMESEMKRGGPVYEILESFSLKS